MATDYPFDQRRKFISAAADHQRQSCGHGNRSAEHLCEACVCDYGASLIQDAERYRWLRVHEGVFHKIFRQWLRSMDETEALDAIIDDAIRATVAQCSAGRSDNEVSK